MPGLEKSYNTARALNKAGLLITFARFISVAFHPLLMPVFGIMLLFNSNVYFSHSLSFTHKSSVVLIIALNTCLLPLLITMYLWKKKMVGSLTMNTAEERRLPYLITAVFFFITYYALKSWTLPPVVYILMLGATMSLLATMLINFKWKISAHMVGIGGVAGAFLSMAFEFSYPFLPELTLLIVSAGLIGTSRLKLGAHNPAQVYAGFFVGAGCEMLLFWLL